MSDMPKKPVDGLNGLIEKIKTDEKVRYGVIGGVLALLLIIIIIVCVSCSGREDEQEVPESDVSVSVNAPGTEQQTAPAASADEAIQQLVNTYYKALETGDSATIATVKANVTEEEKIRQETRAQDIEYIDIVEVFTRPGMTEGTYVVFVYTDTKFVGIETKAPGFSATYVSSREDGSLYLDSSVDETIKEYVVQVAAEEEIANYYDQVLTNYTNALASDPDLKNYMENLNQKLDDAIQARQQEQQEQESAEPVQEAMATQVNETVRTTSKVNVRASDSENADRLGQVDLGTTLTRYETRENGWSKIDYNGQEGFIKSEYLEVAGTNETADAGGQAPPEEPAQTDNAAVSGKVTASSSVRVRSTTNDSSSDNILGTLYPGESCDLIMEQADGWCRVKYNGETGYVKTEFVEIH